MNTKRRPPIPSRMLALKVGAGSHNIFTAISQALKPKILKVLPCIKHQVRLTSHLILVLPITPLLKPLGCNGSHINPFRTFIISFFELLPLSLRLEVGDSRFISLATYYLHEPHIGSFQP